MNSPEANTWQSDLLMTQIFLSRLNSDSRHSGWLWFRLSSTRWDVESILTQVKPQSESAWLWLKKSWVDSSLTQIWENICAARMYAQRACMCSMHECAVCMCAQRACVHSVHVCTAHMCAQRVCMHSVHVFTVCMYAKRTCMHTSTNIYIMYVHTTCILYTWHTHDKHWCTPAYADAGNIHFLHMPWKLWCKGIYSAEVCT